MRPGKLEGFLGIAAKAGKLVYGCELTVDAIRGGKNAPYLVLLAENASLGTKKRVHNSCTYYHREIAELPISCDNLSHAVGKSGLIAVIAVTDRGFAEAIKKLLSEIRAEGGVQRQEVDE